MTAAVLPGVEAGQRRKFVPGLAGLPGLALLTGLNRLNQPIETFLVNTSRAGLTNLTTRF